MSYLSKSRTAGFKQRLLTQKQELTVLEQSAREAAGIVELDQTRQGRLSRMDALQGQAMSAAIQERRQEQIRQIDLALQRIQDGDYGYCLRCGEVIASKRLEYNPSVTHCLACADLCN